MDIQDVDRREVLRYLGYRGQEADGAVAVMVAVLRPGAGTCGGI